MATTGGFVIALTGISMLGGIGVGLLATATDGFAVDWIKFLLFSTLL